LKSKKRVLVLGASGFLGFNIFETLSKKEDLVVYGTYLSNLYNRLSLGKYLLDNKKLIMADLTDRRQVERTIGNGNFDVIIQMAACSTGAKDVMERPYIQVTPNAVMNSWVFQATYDNKVGQVIFPSCTVAYPSSDVPSKETDVDLSPKGPYFGVARMKLFSEGLCQFFAELPNSQTRFTAIRHSNIYGPHDRFDPDRSHVFGATIRKVMESKDGKVVVWGKGQEVRDFLYIDDFVRFIEMVIDKQDYKFDVFNLGSGCPVTIAKLVQKVIDLSGRKLEIVYDSQGPSLGTKISITSLKAFNKFFWSPKVSLNEGIGKTIEWYRKNIL